MSAAAAAGGGTLRSRSPSNNEEQHQINSDGPEESTGLLNEGEAQGRVSLDLHGATNFGTAREEWKNKLERWQAIACWISHALALVAALLVVWWISLLGGVSWKAGQAKKVFNWHPFLMILAFSFMTVAALSFRAPYRTNRATVKLLHWSAWLVAALSATIALFAAFQSHNDEKSGFIANLYSFHSWLGLGIIGLYVLQFLAGFFTFARPLSFVTPMIKAQVLSLHSFLGPWLYIAVAATILLGIQEKEGFVKCSYPVDKADLFPLSHIGLIPTSCLVSHALGITVLAMALCTSFALHNFRVD